MLIRNITYTDFNDEQQTRPFHFHVSTPELIENNLENFEENTYLERLREITKTRDIQLLYKNFKWMILGAYGERSEDGQTFIKTEEATRRFEQSAAYEALYRELMVNAEAAAEFVNNVFPKDMEAFAERVVQNNTKMAGNVPGSAQDTLTRLGVDETTRAAFPAPATPVPATGPAWAEDTTGRK